MVITEERVTLKLLEEVWPLLELHEEELNIWGRKLSPDKAMYIRSSALGTFAAYIAREDGKVIGYAAYWIVRHPHYEIAVASQDILFLHKDYRKGLLGVRLIKESEKGLKEKHNVEIVTQFTKPHLPLDKLFVRLGYKEIEKVYGKEL